MDADARASSHAIQVHVTDELQAANAFDPTITYNKGQAVLRMLEAYLGPDTFRDGIHRYIRARAFSNATSADLWDALSAASGKQVGRIAADWTEQAGFPLVSVAAACDAGKRTISLSQRRFFLSAPLASYLALAERMGKDLDTRAWRQIAAALGTIEYDERQALRRTVIKDLGVWGDPQVISEARRRFAAFVRDRSAIAPDDQSMILDVVGLHADAGTFEQLHTLARESHDESEKHRLYSALAGVRDPKLAAQAAKIALAAEIPPQAVQLRLGMFVRLHDEQPQLAWSSFSRNAEVLLSPFGNMAPLFEAQYVPQIFWNSMPLGEMNSWLKAHVPAEMGPQIEKGMDGARFQVEEKQALVPEADAYLAARAPHA